MSGRRRVLISAYSCEPGKGSEPEVGWQWARQMARWHEVTVLTRANNEAAIREGLVRDGAPTGLRFVYHDLPAPLPQWKGRLGVHDLYYRLWQWTAHKVIARLCAETRFDLLHHVTYAGARFPAAIFGHGVPTIWGPVGGFESMPDALLPWKYPRELIAELARNFANAAAIGCGTLGRRGKKATLAIASTDETASALARGGCGGSILPTVGIQLAEFLPREPVAQAAPLRLVFAGRLVYWKGVELALRALHASGTEAFLDIIGEGRFRRRAEALAVELGMRSRVCFLGQIPRDWMLRKYAGYDVMLYPSIHDTGGFVLLEAMASCVPVICLDCAGPGLIVTDDCGLRVPLGTRDEIIAGLASAIRRYAAEPALRLAHARQARVRVGEAYAWDRKGEAMNAIYEEVLGS
jgi:glycosyltransferase involved in cell wall biosynthesis